MTTHKNQTQNPLNSRSKIFSAVSAVSALIVVACAIGAVGPAALDAQQASITRTAVETLASARLEGRLAGSGGERLAADFLVAELQKIGAKPLPGQQDFRLPFQFTAGTKDGGSTLRVEVASAPERDPGGRSAIGGA